MKRSAGIMINEIAFCNLPVLLKRAGLDFYIIDCEHGGFDYREVFGMASAARLAGGIETIVRLPSNMRKDIVKFMDMGADSLLLPMTNCAADIAEVVKYAKYFPVGERGVSTMRAHTLYNPPPIAEYAASANAHTRIYAQIETKAGVENADEILSVNGVAGCFIGPNDMAVSYGCSLSGGAPEIYAAIERVAECAKKRGKACGIITADKGYLSCAKKVGASAFCKGSELSLLVSGARAVAGEIHEGE